jgi:predicted nucleotidyltransferase
MFGLSASDIARLIQVINSYLDVEEAIVFGSRAMGNYKPGSDVDIALKGNLKPETADDIAIELNERIPLPYKFDVVAYASLSHHQPLLDHIDRYGKTLFKRVSTK